MIERIEDTAGFEKLREEWHELLEDSASNSLFLTWEWLYTWWKHLGERRRLCLITVRCGGELVAIAPLTLRPRRLTRLWPYRALEFLGCGSAGSDYLDVIIRRGQEAEALPALAEYLAHGRFMLELAQLKRRSCVAEELAAQLRQRGWSLAEAETDICPFIGLSGHSWPSYLATLGQAHRHNLQRRLKNLGQQFAVGFEQVGSEEQRRQALTLLVMLHNGRFEERGGSTAFHTPSLLAFHEEFSRLALTRGWLRLFVVWLDGKPAAALYGFRYHRTFYFYQSGFESRYGKQSVGLVTMGLAIKHAIEEGAEEYDLLHGDEEYKFRWAREGRALGRMELYPPGVRGFLYKRAVRWSRTVRKIARRVLPQRMAETMASPSPLPLPHWGRGQR